MNTFETLNAINVNNHTEKKNGLTYLSWAWAWAEIKKSFPDARYYIKEFEGKPYFYDENLGYMVMTEMYVGSERYEMWLPVMDPANKAMKNAPYTYQVKHYERGRWDGTYEDRTVEPASMTDINKTIMRCLVKNMAMFGLGLYIYAGEDLPEELPKRITTAQAATLSKCIEKHGQTIDAVCKNAKVKTLEDLTVSQFAYYMNKMGES